jgi:alkylhydroperoxidase/carboxymuconolactone decarboxylase family protein YurZ
MTAYISVIPEDQATGTLRALYDQDAQARGYIPNFTRALSLRPEVTVAWRNLSATIQSNMDMRRYELATIAAARAMRCSY